MKNVHFSGFSNREGDPYGEDCDSDGKLMLFKSLVVRDLEMSSLTMTDKIGKVL